MNLAGINLNLLLVFDATMEQQTVSQAAKQLGIGRSTTSKALSRLRAALQDELFYGGEDHKLVPTKVAEDFHKGISEPVKQIVAFLNAVTFEPETSTRTFHIAAGDYFTSTVLPRLVARVRDLAPNCTISIFPVNRLDVIEHLDIGDVDIVLGWYPKLPERLSRRVILTDEEVLIVRPGHPLLNGTPTTRQVLSYLQVVVDLGGDTDASPDGFHHEGRVLRRTWMTRFFVDSEQGDEGTIKRPAVTVPYFSALAAVVAVTDMAATLPRRLAILEAERGKVVILTPPYDPLKFGLQAIYTKAHDNDQGLAWLFEQIAAVTEALDH
ncbi:LysR substrate-binding domain-containing protein [Acidisoma silvae]|uniref:LysR family transcriptional regulator n=1 Tax=Acidisoma silvae TaxID=2802396 RepID=A0A963YWG3_9PROT|nr:LysR substrate-binding domain-containing protein [Acidisoma silvae]MCB8877418.1 LysR family transcriptional regulator [Acidisoma silvae]